MREGGRGGREGSEGGREGGREGRGQREVGGGRRGKGIMLVSNVLQDEPWSGSKLHADYHQVGRVQFHVSEW